jgi:hypothetical protein
MGLILLLLAIQKQGGFFLLGGKEREGDYILLPFHHHLRAN